MKSRINLLKTEIKEETPPYIKRMVQPAVTAGMVLFLVLLILNAFFLYYRIQLNDYNKRKADLLSRLNAQQDIEAQILYFSKKENQLVTYLKDDANFLPYYYLLKDILVFSSNSPVLDNMDLTSDRKTNFTVSFDTFKQAYDFLHYVESEDFLKNFTSLSMNSFSVSSGLVSAAKGYQLTFHGQFKNLQ